jgi:hypothetical protein
VSSRGSSERWDQIRQANDVGFQGRRIFAKTKTETRAQNAGRETTSQKNFPDSLAYTDMGVRTAESLRERMEVHAKSQEGYEWKISILLARVNNLRLYRCERVRVLACAQPPEGIKSKKVYVYVPVPMSRRTRT